jgi:dihydrodipicolinate synthase/N-acetylneuraminate lyase
MENGFYPALGTPTNNEGNVVVKSLNKEIELMLKAGAKGVLCMGSMGNMASIRNSEYPKIAKQCYDVVSHKAPVLVGVMDCSVARILDRIDALDNIKIDGVVATAPFYSKTKPVEMVNFFKLLSKRSTYPVYIYDLPSVTQSPITFEIMKKLAGNPNLKGIKTGNLALIMEIQRNSLCPDNFHVFYSGLDLFDVAMHAGIRKNLDGMFTCTPFNAKKLYENLEFGNMEVKSKYLNNILWLRNLLVKENVLSAYSYAMGLLGCQGNYHSDFDLPITETMKEEIFNCMKAINEV